MTCECDCNIVKYILELGYLFESYIFEVETYKLNMSVKCLNLWNESPRTLRKLHEVVISFLATITNACSWLAQSGPALYGKCHEITWIEFSIVQCWKDTTIAE